MAKERFVETYSQGVTNVRKVIVDTETGVNYVLMSSSMTTGCGLTVLLDQDGKPVITPVTSQGINHLFSSRPLSARLLLFKLFLLPHPCHLYISRVTSLSHLYFRYRHQQIGILIISSLIRITYTTGTLAWK